MRKPLVAAIFVVLLGAVPAAAHPSEQRNENGFGGGPHCHVVVAGQSNPAYPSHTAHLAAGNDVFAAIPDEDCA
ncbi:MAG: hypothetical protein GEU78_03280 [Actinobacteria bacterium]|nr:hypothetical protein [Actinomycetota bacterium]